MGAAAMDPAAVGGTSITATGADGALTTLQVVASKSIATESC
jgi:hypothetical protein